MKYEHEYTEKGFFLVPNFISSEEVAGLKRAIEEVKERSDVDIYYDRKNLLRRLERFISKHPLFKQINEKVKDFLFDVTKKEQALFKDKVNFKPPLGEGFFAHYDGVMQFSAKDGIIKNGWYEYAESFNNALITLDDFTYENGPLEVANSHYGNFETLLGNTKRDGTPDIREELVHDISFTPIIASKGSLIVFKHNCPHRSSPNLSSFERGSLYLTYNNLKDGDFYEQYFSDKHQSINPHKSLLGDESHSSPKLDKIKIL